MTADELDPKLAASYYHQDLIGILRWITKIGQINILTAVAMLS
jgi:hypothetical protein